MTHNLFFINDFGLIGHFTLRVILAALLGGIIGYERELRSKEAGLRTHILVAMGAALIMIVSQYGFYEVIQNYIQVDPSRIAAQVVSGIGFLGAGVIFKENGSIKGLSTAAGLWVDAAIGLAVGSGLYTIAIISTILVIIAFEVLNKLSKKFYNNHIEFEVTVKGNDHFTIKKYLEQKHATIISYRVTNNSTEDGFHVVNFKVKVRDDSDIDYIFDIINSSENLKMDYFEIM